jgi:UPF0755 protein
MDQEISQRRYLFNQSHKKHFIALGLFALFLSPLFLFWYYNIALNRSNYPEENYSRLGNIPLEMDVIIPQGATTEEIADILYKKDLINSKTLFKLYMFQTKQTIQAGHFKVPLNLNVKNLVTVLQKGTFDIKLTFLEGWRVEEYSDYVAKKFNDQILAEEFLKIAKPYEGQLFPDTYFFPKLSTAQLLLDTLRNNFKQKTKNLTPARLSFEDTIKIASILEREVFKAEDLPKVAGILIKRLENEWPLDADATVQYAIGNSNNWWRSAITQKDLDTDSPYNLRKYKGLTPTPICNPGLVAIQSAFNPEDSDYWFYLSGKDGKTHFAKTIEEHNINIETYL